MKNIILCGLGVVLFPSLVAAAGITKDQLLDMIRNEVPANVVLQIVKRDCVDFTITPEALIELTPHVPSSVLEAAIACRSGEKATPQDRSTVELSQGPAYTVRELQVLAVIPAVVDGEIENALTAAFTDELRKQRPKYRLIDPLELALHFEDQATFHSNAPISSLLAAARTKGAHAVVLVTGSRFRRLEDPGVRLDVKLVEVNQGTVVWSGGDRGVSNFFNWNAVLKNASRNTVKVLP